MEKTTQVPALIPVEDIKNVITTAPQVLLDNQQSVQRAKDAGQSLLDTIEAQGMNDELDEAANRYLVKIRDTAKMIDSKRKPLTKMFDQIKSVFTSLEADIDTSKAGSIPAKVQAARDAYAKKLREEAAERERKAQLLLAIEKEKIDYRFKVESAINEFVRGKISGLKAKMYEQFNSLTLDGVSEFETKLKSWSPSYVHDTHNAIPVFVGSSLLDSDTLNAILSEVRGETYESCSSIYCSELSEVATLLLDKLPGKVKELEEIKAAKGKEAARLKKEAEERKAKEEEERIAYEAKAKKEADEDAQSKKDAAIAETLFDHTAQQADISTSIASGREGYNIRITNPAGYGLLFAFWLQQEGMKEDVSKLEKKTLGSIKTFCEKHAHKTGDKIESKFIVYEETYKTSAKK